MTAIEARIEQQVGNTGTGIDQGNLHPGITVINEAALEVGTIGVQGDIFVAPDLTPKQQVEVHSNALEDVFVANGATREDAHERVNSLVKLGSGNASEQEGFNRELDELSNRAQTNTLTAEETDWLAVMREVMNDPGVKKAFNQSALVFTSSIGIEIGLLLLDRKYLRISEAHLRSNRTNVKKLSRRPSVRIPQLVVGCTAAGTLLAACGGIAPIASKEVAPAAQTGLTLDSATRATAGWKDMKLVSGRITLGDQAKVLVESDGTTIVSAKPFVENGPEKNMEIALGMTTLTVDKKDTYTLPVMYQYDRVSNTTQAYGLFLEASGAPAKQSETSRTFKIVEFKDGKLVDTGRKLVANAQDGRGLLGILDEKTNTFFYLMDARSKKPATSAPTPPPQWIDQTSASIVGAALWGKGDAMSSATTVLLSLLALPTPTPVPPTEAPKTAEVPATQNAQKPESNVGTSLFDMCAWKNPNMQEKASRVLNNLQWGLLTSDEKNSPLMTMAEKEKLALNRFFEKILKRDSQPLQLRVYPSNEPNGFRPDSPSTVAVGQVLMYAGNYRMVIDRQVVWGEIKMGYDTGVDCHVFIDPAKPKDPPIIVVAEINQDVMLASGRTAVQSYTNFYATETPKPFDVVFVDFVIGRDVVGIYEISAGIGDPARTMPAFKGISQASAVRDGLRMFELGILDSYYARSIRDHHKLVEIFINQSVHLARTWKIVKS